LKARTRDEYRSKRCLHINDSIGQQEIAAITPEMVRRWYGGTDPEPPRVRSHCYSLLHAILATATKDGLLQRNPCHIERAMSTPRKREPIILSVSEVAKLADVIAPQRFKALILLSAWCGLRRVKPSS
jgi:hypothetical protein